MELNRRDFIVLPGVALAASSLAAAPPVPWQRKIRRVGQTNMTEHDPAVLNVEQWADYWASLKVDAVLVSVTGILAFYQTKVPFHRKGKFLGERDFFGDCCAAAKKRGIHVIARMSPDLNWEDAVQAHPEWFQRDAEGNAVHHTRIPDSSAPAWFTTYMTDYMPAIMREINSLYDVDGLYTNAWPPLGALPVCYCDQCRRLPQPGTLAYWDKFNQRTVYLWKLYDSIAKEKNPASFYFANLGGGIRSRPTWCNSEKSASGFSATTRAAAQTTRRSGDVRCRAGLQCRAKGQNGDQRDRRVVTGRPRWRNGLQVAAGKNRCGLTRRWPRNGAVSPHHRRRERYGRGPPLAGAGA